MSAKNVLSVLAALSLAGAAHAAGSIGINFVGLDPTNQTLAAADVAGVAEVEQANWNHLTIGKEDGNGHANGGNLGTVVDSSGKAVKGLTVTVGATESTQVWPVTGASWGFSGANLTLQSGEFSPQAKITVSGVPYPKYNVYVYAAAGDNGGQGSATITAAFGGKVASPNCYFYNFNWQNGVFAVSTATTLDAAKSSSGSNYILFQGNTAKGFTVDWDGKLGGGWTGVSAIQIVAVP